LVDELWDSEQTAKFLKINVNNLRQIQHRGTLVWRKRVWRSVYYSADEVRAYADKRKKRNNG
jgi:hypothetical protein